MMGSPDGIVFAWDLDGRGGGHAITNREALGRSENTSSAWVHLDLSHPGTKDFLRAYAGIPDEAYEALVAEKTRPRVISLDGGFIVNLREINSAPDADPSDMISVRMWFGASHIVSARLRPLVAIDDLHNDLQAGRGPVSAADVIVRVAGNMTDGKETIIDDLAEALDDIEDKVQRGIVDVGGDLSVLRTRMSRLWRFFQPQRAALTVLTSLEGGLPEDERRRLGEITDAMTRALEELDSLGERGALLQDELVASMALQTNRTNFLLTVVAAIFLPLSFLTGLFGVNVGGIPGSGNPAGFVLLCLALLAIAIGLALWFKRRKLF